MALEGRVRSARRRRPRVPRLRPRTGRGLAVHRGLPLGVAWAVLLVLLLVGAVEQWLAAVVVAVLGLAVVELLLHHVLVTAFPRQRRIVLGALDARVAVEQALLLVFVVGADQVGPGERAAVVVAVVSSVLLRIAHTGMGHAIARLVTPRAQIRGLDDAPAPRTTVTPLAGEPGQQVLIAATGLPGLGLLWALATGSYALLAPATVLMGLVVAVVVARVAVDVLALLRGLRGARLLEAVHDAVVRHRPEVVLYVGAGGGPRHTHWVTPWLDVLDHLERPALVVVRHPGLLDALPPAATPVVSLVDRRDVLPFALPDARVALYVSNDMDNLRLLRNPQLRSAFIGHGDSDKSASTHPLLRVYDEVWVAGAAGRTRLLRSDIGLRPDAIRVVGRPQVRHVRHRAPVEPGAPCTVLYAPTWEGLYSDDAESSLLHSGHAVVERLLALEDVQVLYRPHPNTGSRDPRYAQASQRIVTALARAGLPHTVLDAPTTDLHTALGAADVLVTDVTSVITEFVASGRPYVVVNGTDLSASDFQDRFPSTAGAYLVGREGEGLEAALADARGADPAREAREEVRVQLIGPPADDPIGLFSTAIDALGGTPGGRASGADRDAVPAVVEGAA